MDICVLTQSDIPQALALFQTAYADMDVPDDEFDCFKNELIGAFDPAQLYRIHFFCMKDTDNALISMGGIAPSLSMDGSWELRWDMTHPAQQGKGLMSALLEHRITHAKSHNNHAPGLITVAARRPNMFKKAGFRIIFERNPNYAAFMAREI